MIFSRQIKVDGTLTNADSQPALASDPSLGGTAYGIKRLDTGAIVVADSTTTGITHPPTNTGIYVYDFSTAVPGVRYRASWKFVISGTTYYATSEKTAGITEATFLDYDRFITRYGTKNIASASDIENTTSPPTINVPLVGMSLVYAEGEIGDALRGGVYAVPLDWTPNSNILSSRVEEWGFVIAFDYLVRARHEHNADFDEAVLAARSNLAKKSASNVKAVYDDMMLVRNGLSQIPAALATYGDGTTIDLRPSLITPDDLLLLSSSLGLVRVPDEPAMYYPQVALL